MQTPFFIEDQISQILALQMMMKLGWRYISQGQVLEGCHNQCQSEFSKIIYLLPELVEQKASAYLLNTANSKVKLY